MIIILIWNCVDFDASQVVRSMDIIAGIVAHNQMVNGTTDGANSRPKMNAKKKTAVNPLMTNTANVAMAKLKMFAFT